jgi:transcriptional regulator with XRE-family HTH domain
LLNLTLARQRREALGLSLAELGGLVGVDASTLYRWEVGEREPRTIDKLRDWARVLGVDVNDLVGPAPESKATEVTT